ncbi:MAG: MOSC domain-containing protein [Elusimicrobia bacterium]|nr:MOSC domain-containing protein [Elusimicrobiota bacterium]
MAHRRTDGRGPVSGGVVAVCLSGRKGDKKRPVEAALLVRDRGLEGDAHAEGGLRQVSLLARESALTLEAKGLVTEPGDFAENLSTEGIALAALAIGARLRLGRDAVLEITRIGKECHARCAIFRQVGDCVMPREGVFAKVVRGGRVRPGDRIVPAE